MLKHLITANEEVAVCATFQTDLGKVNVYGTIIAYRDFRVKNGSKPWEEHYKSIRWHGQDWSDIVNAEPSIPLIVAGDFNQTRDGSNRYSTPHGIDLLSEELKRNKLRCLTDEDFGIAGKLRVDPKKGFPRANIDQICISAGYFSNIENGAWDHFTEDGIYMSDHNGVFVDLT